MKSQNWRVAELGLASLVVNVISGDTLTLICCGSIVLVERGDTPHIRSNMHLVERREWRRILAHLLSMASPFIFSVGASPDASQRQAPANALYFHLEVDKETINPIV